MTIENPAKPDVPRPGEVVDRPPTERPPKRPGGEPDRKPDVHPVPPPTDPGPGVI
jgi:hypothetical protein